MGDWTTKTGEERYPVIGLVHEVLGHSWDIDQGLWRQGTTPNGIELYEVDAINIENIFRQASGEKIRNWQGTTVVPGKPEERKFIPHEYLHIQVPEGQEAPPLKR